MSTTIKNLLDETLVQVLCFLRASDIASCREVDKAIFSAHRISRAVEAQLVLYDSLVTMSTHIHKRPTHMGAGDVAPAGAVGAVGGEVLKRPDVLYVAEITSITFCLSQPQPCAGKGYWVSASWLSNAKKYFEALPLPALDAPSGQSPHKSPKKIPKKLSKIKQIRQRRGSDSLPPWPSMNADIACPHLGLSLTAGPRAKRRVIESRLWHFLRRFYPEGPAFKCVRSVECAACCMHTQEAKACEAHKREAQLLCRRADLVPPALHSLSARKCGVPMQCLTRGPFYSMESPTPPASPSPSPTSTSPHPSSTSLHPSSQTHAPHTQDSYVSGGIDMGMGVDMRDLGEMDRRDMGLDTGGLDLLEQVRELERLQLAHLQSLKPLQPLVPGLYNLVPKRWLQAWRRYTKDLGVSSLPHLDCASFLCHSHGLLVVPPHVDEYLLGLRRGLTAGLGSYAGQVAEIVTAEEWDELQGVFHSADFNVRFCLDGSQVSWSSSLCVACDPLSAQHGAPSRNQQSQGLQA
ncbi:hypothetical protein B484DRAFT_456082 [Ochromonadaceae sp. CCMP2298]|nr:hypothetical protein B484DRAFT_456082 [Ochromonadaceae sp. CCMP2298]|mmetsp:Transcript_1204/g.2733  ORF Transcript_1204/g.2733 Transcript_1204/m.2733 type:complete len:519 (+) Transcript_1204:318-1874(+)